MNRLAFCAPPEGHKRGGAPREESVVNKKLTRLLAGVGTSAVLIGLAIGGAAPANAAGATIAGCPSGDVCIDTTNLAAYTPQANFRTYGPHNLSNMFGLHNVTNNQTGGALYFLCSGYNGTGHQMPWQQMGGWLGTANWTRANMTPVNSIVLIKNASYSHTYCGGK